jgi:hypothetical protein
MVSPNDNRFENSRYTIQTIADNARTNVRNLARTTGVVVKILDPGIVYECDHIPPEKLNQAERDGAFDGEHNWNVVRFGTLVGWFREDVAVLEVWVKPPDVPPDVPTPPLDEEERIRYTLEQLTMMEYHNQQAFTISSILRSMWEGIE